MAFIGYSDSGFNELASEIRNRKAKLIGILDKFPDVQSSISNSWKGEDATKYTEELNKLVNDTKNNISNIYDEMLRQFQKTHDEWVEKQKGTIA